MPSTTTTHKLAIFGAGLVGRQHVARVAAHPQLELAAIIDPAMAGQAIELETGGSTIIDAALNDPSAIDGAIIATPNDTHKDLAIWLIEAGVPVLIEKPIAGRLDHAEVIIAAAKAHKTPVLVGHHRRHSAILQRAKAIIDAGQLGDIVSVQASFVLAKPKSYFAADWRREPGAGPVFINLVHDIDCLRFLCGDIIDVRAMRANVGRGFAVEDRAAAILRFASGALGTLIGTDMAASPWSWELTAGENPAYFQRYQDCYQIAGTRGALGLPSMRFWYHEGEPDWHAPIYSRGEALVESDPLVCQLDHFIDVIAGAASPIIDAEDAARTLQIAHAIASGHL